jgi:anaerobic selenocysteine-containing dehydrogenase
MLLDGSLTRRGFLKAGFAGVSTLVLTPFGLKPLAESVEPAAHVSLFTGRRHKGIPTLCGLCQAACGLAAFVEEGRLVNVSGNPGHPFNRGALCAMGAAALNLTSMGGRILKPLRRKGARGEGRWEEIGFEEALRELEDRVGTLLSAGDGRKLALAGPSWQRTLLVERFLQVFGRGLFVDSEGWDRPVEAGIGQCLGASGATPVADLAGATFVLNFGADPLGSSRGLVGEGGAWTEAGARGCRRVTVDPRLSATAARSDRWVPLRPGTEGFLALALARELLTVGGVDREFLEKRTDLSLERLAWLLVPWTCEKVESSTGVAARDVRWMAETFAAAERPVAMFGRGITGGAHGLESALSVLLLNFLAGNLDRRGGLWVPGRISWQEPGPAVRADSGGEPVLQGALAPAVESGRLRVGLLLSSCCDPASLDPEPKRTAAVLSSLEAVPFHVALASTWSNTARLADLVLPAATFLEAWGLVARCDIEPDVAVLSLRQPVLEPPEGVRSLDELLLDLARNSGGTLKDAFPFRDVGTYYRAAFESTVRQGPENEWDRFRERGFVHVPVGRPGKGDRYRIAPMMESSISRLSERFVRAQVRPEGSAKTLILFSSPVRGEGRFPSKWVAEIDHDDPVWMHPEAAGRLGLEEGDRVEVKGPVGSLVTRVRLTEGIHPEAVAMSSLPAIPCGEKECFVRSDPDRGLVWWKQEGPGDSARSLVPWPSDPTREAPGWRETLVRIERL